MANRHLPWIVTALGLIFAFLVLGDVNPVQARQNPASTSPAPANPVPTYAYYYIWFDPSSWNRAKIDYPQLGRYSSDDPAVMRQQIQWAKAAGITGFIVSWKSTEVLNRRLEQLTQIAEQENFNLVLIYQGLDFDRNPLPVDRIASDLDVFIQRFATRKPFGAFGKPMVIWSGTWKFSPQEIAQVTHTRRKDLLLLASERNLEGYNRLANMVDGDAYYWSSVNPDTFVGYKDKLIAMSDAIHQHGGVWIPPAAPGFDARLIGGISNVDRKDGETFRTQINTAMASSPDVLGIISWNEFSENSYIEPSVKYGTKYLDLLSQINHMPLPAIGDFDSSEPVATFPEVIPNSRLIALGGVSILVLAGFITIAFRQRNY